MYYVDADTETPGEEEEDETAKNPVTPAVTAGSKERRKPFFRRVSKAQTALMEFHLTVTECHLPCGITQCYHATRHK